MTMKQIKYFDSQSEEKHGNKSVISIFAFGFMSGMEDEIPPCSGTFPDGCYMSDMCVSVDKSCYVICDTVRHDINCISYSGEYCCTECPC